jgi:hypothetical protein
MPDGKSFAPKVSLLTVQFLAWVAARPRLYGEVREAWQSTCPLNSAWEDAMNDDLVAFAPGGAASAQTAIILTTRGRAVLEAQQGTRPRRQDAAD